MAAAMSRQLIFDTRSRHLMAAARSRQLMAATRSRLGPIKAVSLKASLCGILPVAAASVGLL